MNRAFEEIEAKFLDIEPAKLETRLKTLGAERKFKKLFRRQVFDLPGRVLNARGAWLRVRDEGDRVTMTFKQRLYGSDPKKDEGVKEVEVVVSDFEPAIEILKSAGMQTKFYEENWRTLYTLEGLEICIDEWPLIPPYLEIEGDSWEKVDAMAEKLGFDPKDKLVCPTMEVYKHYGIDENDYGVLTFDRQEKVE